MIEIVRRPEVHEAEAAGVVEGDPCPALHLEGRRGRVSLPRRRDGGIWLGFLPLTVKRPVSAEVHDQRLAWGQFPYEVLRPAAGGASLSASVRRWCKVRGNGKREVLSPGLHGEDAFALPSRGQVRGGTVSDFREFAA